MTTLEKTVRTTLEDEQRQDVGRQLQAELNEVIDLALQGKQAHWNVVGPQFRPLHLQLDELVDAYRGWSDRIAERLTAIGLAPDGQAGHVAETSTLQPLPSGPIRDTDVVNAFVERVHATASRTRQRVHDTEIDPVSQDLLIEILEGLEEQLWMLQAQLR